MKHGQLGLRPAEEKDCRLLWRWKNEEGVRASAFNSRFIPYKEHKQWFEEKLKNLSAKILILLDFRKREVGQVRFDINYNEVAEIGISVDKDERGKGYGAKGLELACEYAFNNLKIKRVRAHIKEDNKVSLDIFTKAGFINDGLKEFKNHQCYEMSLENGQFRGKSKKNFVG